VMMDRITIKIKVPQDTFRENDIEKTRDVVEEAFNEVGVIYYKKLEPTIKLIDEIAHKKSYDNDTINSYKTYIEKNKLLLDDVDKEAESRTYCKCKVLDSENIECDIDYRELVFILSIVGGELSKEVKEVEGILLIITMKYGFLVNAIYKGDVKIGMITADDLITMMKIKKDLDKRFK